MKKKSVVTRIAVEYDTLRRAAVEKGIAEELTEIDRMITKEARKLLFKEKEEEKKVMDGWVL